MIYQTQENSWKAAKTCIWRWVEYINLTTDRHPVQTGECCRRTILWLYPCRYLLQAQQDTTENGKVQPFFSIFFALSLIRRRKFWTALYRVVFTILFYQEYSKKAGILSGRKIKVLSDRSPCSVAHKPRHTHNTARTVLTGTFSHLRNKLHTGRYTAKRGANLAVQLVYSSSNRSSFRPLSNRLNTVPFGILSISLISFVVNCFE